jgi:hypothetical protein
MSLMSLIVEVEIAAPARVAWCVEGQRGLEVGCNRRNEGGRNSLDATR